MGLTDYLTQMVALHGYALVALIVGFESMGFPVPGETTLVTAAIFAGTTHQLSITFVIAAAIVGAIVGDNLGYAVGRRFGYRLLVRYGPWMRITTQRLKLGQFLFARHGGKVVFFGRFVALLRALAAVLAGINRMPWRRFLFFNAAGAILWVTAYGLAGYLLGAQMERVRGPLAWAGVIGAVIAAVIFFLFVRRHEERLAADAERYQPGL
jgi:membrane protein DedA with SNARE-associated domain